MHNIHAISHSWADPEGVTGGPDLPLKNRKNIGFLQYCSRTSENPSHHSMLGHRRPASETPFKWRFAGGPMMTHYYWYLDPLSLIIWKNNKKKPQSELDSLWQNFLDPRLPLFFMADPDEISHCASFYLGLQFAKVPVKVYKALIISWWYVKAYYSIKPMDILKSRCSRFHQQIYT